MHLTFERILPYIVYVQDEQKIDKCQNCQSLIKIFHKLIKMNNFMRDADKYDAYTGAEI